MHVGEVFDATGKLENTLSPCWQRQSAAVDLRFKAVSPREMASLHEGRM